MRAPQSRWTRCRSPGVSLTAFTAHLPNLQPGLVVDTGLRGSGPARPTQTASYSVPVRQVAALLPRFLQTAPRGHRPCASLALCLHQTWAEDLHLRAVKHARHTQRYGKRVRTPRRTTAPGRAFPTPLWTAHTTRRPQAPQAVIICLHKHDNASRISKTRDDRDGRRLTDTRRFAPTSVHLRRNRRSRSPESVFNFSGIRTQGLNSTVPPSIAATRRSISAAHAVSASGSGGPSRLPRSPAAISTRAVIARDV